MSGVSIICFAASYSIALALEITRLLFRSGLRGAIMLGFAGAGLFAHTVYLYYRVVQATGSPLSSRQDWCLVAAWALAATYLYLTYYHPRTAFGLFILPLVLGLIATGTYLADPEPFAREPASRVWGTIHGASILLGTVAVLVGFAAGLMYLGQAYRLKHKLPPQRGLRLPSLEWLERANSRAIGIATLMLGAGILSGVILNLVTHESGAERLPWSDPVVLSTLVMFGWLVLCVGIGLFYKPAREGRRVALVTLFSFVFLAVALALVLFGSTQHGGSSRSQRSGRRGQGIGFTDQGLGISDQRSGSRGQGLGRAGRVFEAAGACSTGASGRSCVGGLGLEPRSPFGTHGPQPVGLAPRRDRLLCICPPLTTPHSPLPTHHSPLPTPHSPPCSWRSPS